MMVATLASCKRDHLYYASEDMALIYVDIDWSYANLKPNGASVYAYWANTGKLYRAFDPFSNPNQGTITLPQGTFNLLVINNTPEEYEGSLTFAGENNWETFRTETELDTRATRNSKSFSRADETFIDEPDTLASDRILDFEVTEAMTHRYYYDVENARKTEASATVEATPQRVMSVFRVNVHVKGLKYAVGSTPAFLRGMSRGYYLGLDCTTSDPCTHMFYLNNRKYDEGSTSDGTISAAFNTFGLLPEGWDKVKSKSETKGDETKSDTEGNTNAPDTIVTSKGLLIGGSKGLTGEEADIPGHYYLDMEFILSNGDRYPLTFDVTDNIDINLETEVKIQLALKLELDIELPEVIGPDPEGGGSGFQTDVSDWDNETIDLPM